MSYRTSIKAKLTAATLIPLCAAIVACWLVGVFILNNRIVSQTRDKVRNDLNTGREIYQHELDQIRTVVRFAAASPFTAEAIRSEKAGRIAPTTLPLLKNENLDILAAVDATGKVLYRAQNPAVAGDYLSNNQFIKEALRGKIVSGTSVFSPEALRAEGNGLADRARITALPTPQADPQPGRIEESGMFLIAAAPVRDPGGTIVGALYGGVLLNNNNRIVDRIKEIVYEGVKFGGTDIGGATIFMGDLRIATNVTTQSGSRAIGTRMSEQVFKRVILNRQKWLDRAFVVNDWSFTAYEPITSLQGVPIGALYVGMPERPYTAIKFNLGLLYSGVLLFGTIIGIGASGLIGSRLSRPVRVLEQAARRIAAGERNIEIAVESHDEIGSLATEFKRMASTLQLREQAISDLNRGLEQKVLERTAELEEKNRLLVQTRAELVRAEKLAAIGELAAGVSHEINNPLAIIRGNAELLQMTIPPDADNREEVDTIYQQVGRMERIVANLLSFARQQQKSLGKVDVNGLLQEIVGQLGFQVPLSGISVVERFSPDLGTIDGDAGQLRQVFTNLLLNGVQAMQGSGTLTLTTARDLVEGTCVVAIGDTGCGIPASKLQEIFNPFFTTKENGTGLGLSVSYGIVRDHGGKIEVQSGMESGTIFTVTLPLRQMSPQ